jgi:nitroreductase
MECALRRDGEQDSHVLRVLGVSRRSRDHGDRKTTPDPGERDTEHETKVLARGTRRATGSGMHRAPHGGIGVLDAIYRRRATRAFTSAPVLDASILELLRAAVQAPTAMHLEPWAFVIVQDPAVLALISERAKTIAATPDGHQHRELARTPRAAMPAMFSDPNFNIFYDANTLIVICARPISAFATADCWLAAENLMLAATALRLATCPIGFAQMALGDPAIKAELGIPADVTPVVAIIVGVAASEVAPTSRREPQILSWKK